MSAKEFMSNCMNSLEEASPRIKIVLGVVGLVGAGIAACIASSKVKEETKEERKAFKDIHKIRHAQKADETGEKLDPEETVSDDVKFVYTDKDFAKDVVKTSLSYGKKILKLYGVPIAITGLSIALIFNGTHVLNARYLAMSASYGSIKKAFDLYKERVKERYGEEAEKDIRYGIKTEKVKEEIVDEETGEKKKVTKEIKVAEADPTACSPYAMIFDERFGEYVNDIGMNEALVKAIQSIMNEELLGKGKRYLVMDNLLDRLGAPEDMYTGETMICGWRKKSGQDDSADGYIDLRIQRIFIMKDGKRVPRILIDPNVEGNIYDKVVKDLKYSA